jgi:hypothetical protein
LSAAIVVVAFSMLLYNITRNFHNRVARTSGAVLACVAGSYLADVLLSLSPNPATMAILFRLQWIGIALFPATIFHLADALLATTGLPSRGRRRNGAIFLYSVGSIFLLLATFTQTVIEVRVTDSTATLNAGPIFPVYVFFFASATLFAFFNVYRARQRGQTRSTKTRMAYLLITLLTPVIGIFPYSLILPLGNGSSVITLTLVNITNIVVVLMLMFLAYPLSFFGSSVPDRVVKAELLRFMLRGPVTGMLILAVIIFLRPLGTVFGITGDSFLPFAVVSVVLFWQWMIDLGMPTLEKRLIYADADQDQVNKIQELNRYLLTRADLLQLVEGILEALSDYLVIRNTFVATLYASDYDEQKEVLRKTGNVPLTTEQIRQSYTLFTTLFEDNSKLPKKWDGYWVLGLYSRRKRDQNGSPSLIGILGIEAQSDHFDPNDDEERWLGQLIRRAAITLDDLLLQTEIYAALEGLLPQMATTRSRAADIEFKPGRDPIPDTEPTLERDQVIEQVQAALRHYYGGPGMAQSRLLELNIVQNALPENENNPVRALRSVLDRAIGNQRPEGDQDFRSPEWLLYNILEMRFLKNKKVRDLTSRLYMSEATFFRKQAQAIEAVADAIMQMEAEATGQVQPTDLTKTVER